MDRTTPRRSSAGRGGHGAHRQRISFVADLCQIAGFVAAGLVFALPAIARFAHLLLLLAGLVVLLVGARHLLGGAPRADAQFAMWTAALGAGLALAALHLPPIPAAGVGAAMALLLLRSATRRQIVPQPASSVRYSLRLPAAVPIASCVFFVCTGLALAVVIHGDQEQGDSAKSDPPGGAPKENPPIETELEEDAIPTYAESCEAMPDPGQIGHKLGELFESEGAIKAGCGSKAINVPGTGTWVAAGICEGEMRSVAISAPDNEPVILYGAPAAFAWEATQKGTLIAAEAAQAAGGDVNLVEVVSGTYGFARSSRSITPGREDIRFCGEVSGRARPFVRLAPSLVLLWRELLEHEASWSWPTADSSAEDGDPIAFVSYPTGELIADGGCKTDSECHLDVDGERWPGRGTAFVSLAELGLYMPQPTS